MYCFLASNELKLNSPFGKDNEEENRDKPYPYVLPENSLEKPPLKPCMAETRICIEYSR